MRIYLWISFLLSCYYLPCSGMESFNYSFFDIPTTHKKRKKPDDLLWQAQYITANDHLVVTLKLPLFVYTRRKNNYKDTEQQTFLEKFKKVELPYILTEDEKKIFDSLECSFLFTVEQTEEGWKISPSPALPIKMIDINSMWKRKVTIPKGR